jgi:activator of 2-hydroxyglutaryl-CoA dehydratase
MTEWLVVDVGSTTTKALFIENSQVIAREEAETTVEKPFENVEVGFRKAVALIKQRVQKNIEDSNFLFTSSAGGGLQVIAVGITSSYTAKNTCKLATGVGAVVIDTLAFDDGRTPYERLDSLNKHRPT